MNYCLDTSALNSLNDDTERRSLVSGLLATSRIYVTALNVIEVCKTPDAVRRTALLKLLREIGKNLRPLAEPNDYLQRIAVAFRNRQSDLELSIGAKEEGLWDALLFPDSIPDANVTEAVRWSSENEDGLFRANSGARPEMQRLYADGKVRPSSAARWIKEFIRSDDDVVALMMPLYEYATSGRLSALEFRRFLEWSPEWFLYMAAWLHSLYRQAIQLQNFGRRRNAGMMDLLCAVYLPRCDVFVTHDSSQRRALRVLSRLSPTKPRIQSYSDFRRRLLVL